MYCVLWGFRDRLDRILDNDINFKRQVQLEYERNGSIYSARVLNLEVRRASDNIMSGIIHHNASSFLSNNVQNTVMTAKHHLRMHTAPRHLKSTFMRRNSDVINGTPNRVKNKWAEDRNIPVMNNDEDHHDENNNIIENSQIKTSNNSIKRHFQPTETGSNYVGTPLRVDSGTPLNLRLGSSGTPAGGYTRTSI